MPKQKQIFHINSGGRFEMHNDFRSSEETESKTTPVPFKTTATQKVAIESAAKEDGLSTSAFVLQSIDDFFELRPVIKSLKHNGRVSKILKYEAAVCNLLDSLP